MTSQSKIANPLRVTLLADNTEEEYDCADVQINERYVIVMFGDGSMKGYHHTILDRFYITGAD
jgi:hypothetical protein